ncbi:MAG: lactate dehydrogenase [Planctomycetaceae bacterium]|nr:lactate dehydrogenase [Planctomycetaceae bacterium]
MPIEQHRDIVAAAYAERGYTADECRDAVRICELASWHGIHTHNALKALHLDDLFGTGNKVKPGCVPGASIEKQTGRFKAAQTWNANQKFGPSVAFEAFETCMGLADEFGVGIVSVDRTFHYLWGGGYVIDAAKKGYIAYTNCTAALAEVVPFGGRTPTLGTNPHTYGLPTVDAVGFPLVIDWATSVISMGGVQALKREGKELPAGAAVDADGNETRDPNEVAALMTFGAHKGYGLSLINELFAAYTGAGLPTVRSRPQDAEAGEKTSANFFFQAIHPDALSGGDFSLGRSQSQNIKEVLVDMLGHGNRETGRCILPGQIEYNAAVRSEQHGGLIFTEAEVRDFADLARKVGVGFDAGALEAV